MRHLKYLPRTGELLWVLYSYMAHLISSIVRLSKGDITRISSKALLPNRPSKSTLNKYSRYLNFVIGNTFANKLLK